MAQVHELPENPRQVHLVQNHRTSFPLQSIVVLHKCIPRTIPARAGGWALKKLKIKNTDSNFPVYFNQNYELPGLFSPVKFSPKIANFPSNGSPFRLLSKPSFQRHLYIYTWLGISIPSSSFACLDICIHRLTDSFLF